jgi:hypothetical protein
MIRLVVFVVVGGAVFAAILHVPFWLTGGVLVVIVVAAAASGVLVLRCPACRKRVKLGATVCHHCGRPVVRGAA